MMQTKADRLALSMLKLSPHLVAGGYPPLTPTHLAWAVLLKQPIKGPNVAIKRDA